MKKEKVDKQIAVMTQPSLYESFEKKCEEEHRTVSEVIRELMSRYSQGWIQTPNRKILNLDCSKLSLSELENVVNSTKTNF